MLLVGALLKVAMKCCGISDVAGSHVSCSEPYLHPAIDLDKTAADFKAKTPLDPHSLPTPRRRAGPTALSHQTSRLNQIDQSQISGSL
jgi:hypothetical protein